HITYTSSYSKPLHSFPTRRSSDLDVVIHLAAHLSKDPADAETTFRTNVEGTVNLLREMESNSIFIFASTKDVYGPHADDFEEVRSEEHTSELQSTVRSRMPSSA